MGITVPRVRFVAAATITIALALLCVNLATQHGGVTVWGPELGADYPSFYIAGQILNTCPERLYDLTYQEQLYRELAPDAPKDRFLFYPGAPFLAVLFQPLATLPYAWSYASWLAAGAALALTGFWLLCRACKPCDDWLTASLAGLSFTPLLLEGWVGGQTTALLFFSAAAAVYLYTQEKPVAAGAVLTILACKPTLLLLLVSMLCVTRSIRVLVGMAIGGLGLLTVSLWAVGYDGCVKYLRFLSAYAEVKRLAPDALKPWKYVDLRSAIYPIFYRPSLGMSLLLAILAIAAAILLIRTWLRSDWRVNWASALILTPILSPHCAVYDTALMIPAVFLTAPKAVGRFLPLAALVYVTAWFSQPVSMVIGVQPLTFAMAALGIHLCLVQTAAVEVRPLVE